MTGASRDVIRAVLEMRDRRHNETHAALVALYQALVAELLQSGAVSSGELSDRLGRAQQCLAAEVHGENGRLLIAHVRTWLDRIEHGLPVPEPERWTAPPPIWE
jgi:hypothetical protein